MTDLVAFLNARLYEDEAAARAAAGAPWMPDIGTDAVTEHIARHDPARVLREIAVKRAIVDFYVEPPNGVRIGNAEAVGGSDGGSDRTRRPLSVIEAIALDLADVWSDHPDYDPAWKPTISQP